MTESQFELSQQVIHVVLAPQSDSCCLIPSDIANGVEVLYRAILLLDEKLAAKPTA
jgi:hypothetical protein